MRCKVSNPKTKRKIMTALGLPDLTDAARIWTRGDTRHRYDVFIGKNLRFEYYPDGRCYQFVEVDAEKLEWSVAKYLAMPIKKRKPKGN